MEYSSNMKEYKNECNMVLGGDVFKQFASDFDEISWKTAAT